VIGALTGQNSTCVCLSVPDLEGSVVGFRQPQCRSVQYVSAVIEEVSSMKSAKVRALDSKARRAAKRAGLIIRKSRKAVSANNLGGYTLIDPATNVTLAGGIGELTAQDVIDICQKID
jgi:hypothetical protein